MGAIMAGRDMVMTVGWGRDLSLIVEPSCLVAHLIPWRSGATLCNAAIHTPTCVVVFAEHFQRASGDSMAPEKNAVRAVARQPLIATEPSGNK
jgi:hypothetical protein